MIYRIKTYLWGSVFRRGATLLTGLTLVSYVLGLVRDILFAHFFGASRMLDIYNAAFIIPDLLLNIFIAGALTAAFVPVFVHLRTDGHEVEAESVATTVMFTAPIVMILLSVPLYIFMPSLSRIIAPGFDSMQRETLILLSRIMLLSPIIFAVSNTLGNILVSYEKFLGYGLSPILYNLGIIAGVPLTYLMGMNPVGLVLGTLAGAILHLFIRLFSVAHYGFILRFPIQLGNKSFRQILKLMIPRMAGQPIEQIIFTIFTNMASTLFVGSIAILSFARNFQSVPISIFGISFSTAIFASLSRKAAEKDSAGFLRHFSETAKAIAITTIGSAVIFVLGGQFIIQTLLGGGLFTPEAVSQTAVLLAFFAFSIPSESFIHLLLRSFYALKDTWTPIMISIPGLFFVAILAKFLLPIFSLNALPLSYSIASIIEATILYLILRRKLNRLS